MYVTIFALKIAPMFGWNRFETFEFGCTVAFHDSSAVCRSYVITALVVVFVLPFGERLTPSMEILVRLYLADCA